MSILAAVVAAMPDLAYVVLALGGFAAVRARGARLRAAVRAPMVIDLVIGGVVAVLLLGYLGYALLRPERF